MEQDMTKKMKFHAKIDVYKKKKRIKSLSNDFTLIEIGKNRLYKSVQDEIVKKGWIDKYEFEITLSENDSKEFAGSTLRYVIINWDFLHQNFKSNVEKIKELEKLNSDANIEFKMLGEKFLALEQINETLKQKVRELSHKIDQNTRITVPEEEIKRIKQYALQKFFEDFSNPYSTFKVAVQSGLNSPESSVKTYVGGFNMVLGMLENVFSSHGLKIVMPQIGTPFDPSTQKALEFVIDDSKDENTIVKVNSEAFLLHDRVIKPALVILSKKSK